MQYVLLHAKCFGVGRKVVRSDFGKVKVQSRSVVDGYQPDGATREV